MQCKCGGSTRDHAVVRDKNIVARYARCVACGFVHFWWFAHGWTREAVRKTAKGDDV